MHRIGWTALAAGMLILAGSSVGWASDTVRLVDRTNGSVDGDVDTELVVYRGGGYGYRGYGGYGNRGYGGYGNRGYGGYGGYGYRGYGGYGGYGYRGFGGYGYRGYGYGSYRPYYGYGYRNYGYYRPYYYGGYSPYSYGGYYGNYSNYYGNGGYYGNYGYGYGYRISDTCLAQPQLVMPQAAVLNSQSEYQIPQPRVLVPQQHMPNADQTYPYDGGPMAPLPMPNTDVTPNQNFTPRQTVPLDGKVVMLPRETTGEVSQVGTEFVRLDLRTQDEVPAQPVTVPSTNQNRYTYPAYGESLPPVTRSR